MRLKSSNNGWHQRWLYLKNDADFPLPMYDGTVIDREPIGWARGTNEEEKAGIDPLV